MNISLDLEDDLIEYADPDNRLDARTNGLLARKKKEFKGITIHEHYKGKEVKNKYGRFYCISCTEGILPKSIPHEIAQHKLLLDLKVIKGIAEITERSLKKQGYLTVDRLVDHHQYGIDASQYSTHIYNKNCKEIYGILLERFTSSHRHYLLSSAFFDISEIVFLDIETLGLHHCHLFLIGVAYFKNNTLHIDQFFLRNLTEEKAALYFLNQLFKKKKAICSFNGKTFDIPFLQKRMKRYDLNDELNHPHFDMRYLAPNGFSYIRQDARLVTYEQFEFDTIRTDDVPSHLVPDFYQSYLRSNNIGSIIPIIEHNKQDLITTTKLFLKLYEIEIKS